MIHDLKINLKSLLGLGALLVLSILFLIPGQTFAIAGEGAAEVRVGTGDNASVANFGTLSDAAVVHVGEKSYLQIILEIGAFGIEAGDENVTVQIPANLFEALEWDILPRVSLSELDEVGEWYVSYSNIMEEAGAVNVDSISAFSSGIIRVESDAKMNAGGKLIVTVVVRDGAHSMDPQDIIIKTDDAGGDPQVLLGGLPTIETVPAPANLFIELSDNEVGEVDMTIHFTLPIDLVSDDRFVLTIPEHLASTSDINIKDHTFEGGGTLSGCSEGFGALICTFDGPINAGEVEVTLGGFSARYASTNDIDDFEVRTQGNVIASTKSAPLTDSMAASVSASMDLADPSVNSSTEAALSFLPPVYLSTGDIIQFNMPSHLDISSMTFIGHTFDGNGDFDCMVSGQEMTCEVMGGRIESSSEGMLEFEGIEVDSASPADVTNFLIAANGLESNPIATDSIVPLTDSNGNVVTPPPAEDNCAGFTDVPANHSNCEAITYVKDQGIFTGNPDGTLNPNGSFQRDQSAKVALMTFGLFDESEDYCDGVEPFTDMTSSMWSWQYVCLGKDLGMITGYLSGVDAGKFVPARSVSVVEAFALMLRNLDEPMPSKNSPSYTGLETGQWYSGYAAYAFDHSLYPGSSLDPTEKATRLDIIKMIYQLNELGKI